MMLQEDAETGWVPTIRIHDARYTFATMMLELGESPKTVETMLGHSRVSITLDIHYHQRLKNRPKSDTERSTRLH